MSYRNRALIFTKIPSGFPLSGEHLTVKDVGPFDTNQDIPAASLLLQTLYISFDPYLRALLRHPGIKSYFPPLSVGAALPSLSLAKVLRSTLDGYSEGDVIRHSLPVQEYSVFTQAPHSDTPQNLDLSDPDTPKDLRHWLGVLGMPGLTAYSSLYEIGKPKRGETIVVTSAAGAVGQLVGQLAKHEGLTVLGSVGSDDKLEFITKELGFDGGWNYKTEKGSTKEIIERLTNGTGIDIFYDNVGGEQLEGALDTLNYFGRIVACGQISQYNIDAKDRYPIYNTMQVVSKRLTMTGFIVSDDNMGLKYAASHRDKVSKCLKDGTFKAKVHETVGIENAAEAFIGMLKGENFGKAVLKIEV
ncbi:uncharacterized protein A1O9_13018 [Exophiala aquamarina CBS 119918]|uniref:Enoyl reductase (ER) domain-containing protein n=1 Tax=Exophiala aquamarina CBS 119918 TaxID=1182545 RepID=A0A072NTF9_9EURO|nr:uncharacterized protein A1O9_13018 [Exophiala aquamarina CBS 119918]KEF50926.1 hypothetical protein A1O9_13018 [Exophiala aquamarina CBS 119918]